MNKDQDKKHQDKMAALLMKGGGRYKWEDEWYNLFEEELARVNPLQTQSMKNINAFWLMKNIVYTGKVLPRNMKMNEKSVTRKN